MPETELITLTDKTFTDTVRGATLPLVVDFWAEWCPPCGPMARTLAELAPEFDGRLLIAKINADENPETTRAYRVMSLPTLLFFTGGSLTGQLVGLKTSTFSAYFEAVKGGKILHMTDKQYTSAQLHLFKIK